MTFTDPILGGESKLVRRAIQSPDYVAGVSGWSINRDGSAEFNNAVYRGELRVNGTNGSYVRIFNNGGLPIVATNPQEYTDPTVAAAPQGPGAMYSAVQNTGLQSRGYTEMVSPEFIEPGHNYAFIRAYSDAYNLSIATRILLGAAETFCTDLYVMADLDVASTAHVTGATTLDGTVTVGGELNLGTAVPRTANGTTTAGTTSSTSFTNTLTTTGIHGVSFIAPPSGAVYITGHANSSNNTAGAFSLCDFEVRTGDTVGSGTVVRAGDDGNCSVLESGAANDESMHALGAMVTGLTPGANYNVAMVYKSGGVGTVRFTRRHLAVLPQGNI